MPELKYLISLAYCFLYYIQLLNLILAFSRVLVSSFTSSKRRASTKTLNANLQGILVALRLQPRFLLRLSFAFFRAI
jgi:uncharacterized protein (UPF0333 family)